VVVVIFVSELAVNDFWERAGLFAAGKKDLTTPYPFAINDIQCECIVTQRHTQAHGIASKQQRITDAAWVCQGFLSELVAVRLAHST